MEDAYKNIYYNVVIKLFPKMAISGNTQWFPDTEFGKPLLINWLKSPT